MQLWLLDLVQASCSATTGPLWGCRTQGSLTRGLISARTMSSVLPVSILKKSRKLETVLSRMDPLTRMVSARSRCSSCPANPPLVRPRSVEPCPCRPHAGSAPVHIKAAAPYMVLLILAPSCLHSCSGQNAGHQHLGAAMTEHATHKPNPPCCAERGLPADWCTWCAPCTLRSADPAQHAVAGHNPRLRAQPAACPDQMHQQPQYLMTVLSKACWGRTCRSVSKSISAEARQPLRGVRTSWHIRLMNSLLASLEDRSWATATALAAACMCVARIRLWEPGLTATCFQRASFPVHRSF